MAEPIVHGRVSSPSSASFAALKIEVVDRNVGSDLVIGTAETDASGGYSATYSREKLGGTDKSLAALLRPRVQRYGQLLRAAVRSDRPHSTGNVTDDTAPQRRLDEMSPSSAGNGGAIYMFEPGGSVGFSHLEYSSEHTTLFNVGFAPHASAVPYFPGGVSQPFGGPSEGVYVGARFGYTF